VKAGSSKLRFRRCPRLRGPDGMAAAPLVASGEPAVFDKGSSRMCKERLDLYSVASRLAFNLTPGPIVVDSATVRM